MTGEVFRNARASKKLTQQQLATLAGVSLSEVQKLEKSGLKRNPAWVRVAKGLGVDIKKLTNESKIL